jgi:hypothetical protein
MPCKYPLSPSASGALTDTLVGSRPSPLDALIASHVHLLLQLDPTSHLRRAAENEPELCQYVERVMRYASDRVSRTD